YLHPIDDNHLLAVGRDGSNAQVSLFDVSDMAHPRRLDVFTVLGGWGTWSSAENDPHAFAYFPDQHVLALPVENGSGSSTLLLNVDISDGLSQLGTVPQKGWSGQQRNVRIGQYLYTFTGEYLKVVDLDSPQQVAAE